MSAEEATKNGTASKFAGSFAVYLGQGEVPVNSSSPPIAEVLNQVATEDAEDCIGEGDDYLFDPSILQNIPWSKESRAKFKEGISAQTPGHNLVLRPLHRHDYRKGILDILGMLTSVGVVAEEQFQLQFDTMRKCPHSYFVTVVEDQKNGKIIGCATLLIEYKFIHSAGVRGRIEDVVVSDEYRGRQLGKLLVETLTVLGRGMGCYKMSLECKDSLIDFYGQCGYKKDEGNNYLQQRFKV